MNFLRRLHKRWRLGGQIREAKSELANLYRQYDKVCRKPGETSVFTATEIGDIGSKIAFATHRLKVLTKEFDHENDPDSGDGDADRVREHSGWH